MLEKYYNQLEFEIKKLPKGRKFKIRELIGAAEWNKLDVTTCMNIGKYFYDKAITNRKMHNIIKPDKEKDVQGEQRYIKI